MGGVGTVAVEARAAGVPSVSLDVDPVSVFVARVKTTPILPSVLEDSWEHLWARLKPRIRPDGELAKRMFQDIRIDEMRRRLADVGETSLADLDYWFRRYVLVDFGFVNHSIHNGGLPSCTHQRVRAFFAACLMSSIRRISNADPSPVSGLEITSHMLERLEAGYEIDVFGEFARRTTVAIRQMKEFVSLLRENGTYSTFTQIIHSDNKYLLEIIRRFPSFKPNLILTSPPYCNAIEYWRRHRLEYIMGKFLDESGIIQLHRRFIGRRVSGGIGLEAKPIGFRPLDSLMNHLASNGRAHKARLLWQYFDDMKTRLITFKNVLPRGGHCIIVVGNSQTGGKLVPTVKSLQWIASRNGFDHLGTSEYVIKNRTMNFPTKNNIRIESEHIIALRRR